ncbi:hypothetical protein GX48_04038 [Paracoccidioides brasiliensis]|nr:hypothetical protein GX48_04038 [Paracoccidioides brasiliensis]
MTPQRTSASEYMTSLHLILILSPVPHPIQVPENKRVGVLKYELSTLCRASSLVYPSKALWDQRESADKCIRYLDHMVTNVLEYDIERDFPIESFSWLLLEDRCDFDLRNPDRACSDSLELLFSFLMLRPPDFNITVEKFKTHVLQLVEPEYRVQPVE